MPAVTSASCPGSLGARRRRTFWRAVLDRRKRRPAAPPTAAAEIDLIEVDVEFARLFDDGLVPRKLSFPACSVLGTQKQISLDRLPGSGVGDLEFLHFLDLLFGELDGLAIVRIPIK